MRLAPLGQCPVHGTVPVEGITIDNKAAFIAFEGGSAACSVCGRRIPFISNPIGFVDGAMHMATKGGWTPVDAALVRRAVKVAAKQALADPDRAITTLARVDERLADLVSAQLETIQAQAQALEATAKAMEAQATTSQGLAETVSRKERPKRTRGEILYQLLITFFLPLLGSIAAESIDFERIREMIEHASNELTETFQEAPGEVEECTDGQEAPKEAVEGSGEDGESGSS